MADVQSPPIIQFFRLIESARPPQRADRSAGGTLSTRAFRYCEPVTTAAALGWYVFPAICFQLYWTGTEIFWTYQDATTWYPLGAAQFPHFRDRFDQQAPPEVKSYSPTFLGALPESGILQIWSGLIAKTRPGWSLVARGQTNLPRSVGYDVYEGVIETDNWFGPLFVNIRVTLTGAPIGFDTNRPLFQVQPIQREAYSDSTLDNVAIHEFDTMTPSDWAAYHRDVVQPSQTQSQLGAHASVVRKRRHAEVTGRLDRESTSFNITFPDQ